MYMTRKFENDYTSTINHRIKRQQAKPKPHAGDADALENWIDDTQTSLWAIKNDEAHLK